MRYWQLWVDKDFVSRPVVDTNAEDVPSRAHVLWLAVEIAVDGLAAHFDLRGLPLRELRLNVVRKLNLCTKLNPRPIASDTKLGWRRLTVVVALEVGGEKVLSSIHRNLNPHNASTATRVCHARNDHLSILCRNDCVVRGIAQHGLNRQTLDDGPFLLLHLAAVADAGGVSRDALLCNMVSVGGP